MYNEIVVLLFICVVNRVNTECPTVTGGSYNLAALQDLELKTIYNNQTYYISLCSDSKQCSGSRGCIVDDTGDVEQKVSLGDVITTQAHQDFLNVTISGSGDVVTYITMLCAKSIGRPEVQYNSGSSIHVVWESIAGCPDNTETVLQKHPCYAYSTDKQLFDLSHLLGTNYHIPVSDTVSVYFAVCGAVTGDKACDGGAACYYDSTSGSSNIGVGGMTASDTGIMLDYVIADESNTVCPQKVTTVHMMCAPEQQSLPVLLHTNKPCTYEIYWRTDHACQITPVHDRGCQLRAHGRSLDLSPLSKQEYNVKSGLHNYDIAVCTHTKVPCNNTPLSSGCVSNMETGKAWSMGSYHDGNLVWDDSGLTLMYTGGTSCSSGQVRSTKIVFICDKTVDKGMPELTADIYCFYSFIWRTKYACPSQQDETWTCAKYGIKGELYDLGHLAYTKWVPLSYDTSTNSNLIMSVCGNLAECPDASLCRKMENGTYERVAGPTDHFKVNDDRSLKLAFEGAGVCAAQQTSLTVELTCKQGSLTTVPVLLSSDPCNYLISWETGAACPSTSTLVGEQCKVKDDVTGLAFDVTSLANQTYQLSNISGETDTTLTLSVQLCGSLSNSPCGEGVSVCRSDGVNFGYSHSNVVYKDQSLGLPFSGTSCDEEESYMTLVDFVCHASKVERRVHKLSKCVYYISWTDPAVCPTYPEECLALNSTHSFDLSPMYDLGNLDWAGMVGGIQTSLYLRVCGQVQPEDDISSLCHHTAGVCAVVEKSDGRKEASNLGKTLAKGGLSITSNVISESYVNGDRICKDKTLQAHTRVEYLCSTEKQTKITSVLFNAELCLYLVTVSTPYGCTERQPLPASHNCSIYDPVSGHMTDFSFLQQDLEFDNANSHFRLHVCGAVSSGCGEHGDSAACEIVNGNQISLGDASTTTLTKKDGVFSLHYTNGEQCRGGEQGRNRETILTLVCNQHVHMGVPKYLNSDGESCVYHFELELAAACSPQQLNCNAIGEDLQEYDLSMLKRTDPWAISGDTKPGPTYYISVCSGAPGMCGTQPQDLSVGICKTPGDPQKREGTVLGRLSGEPHVREDGIIQLQYYHGDVCNSDTSTLWTTTVLFICEELTESLPTIKVSHDTCHVTVEWRTLHACPAVFSTGTNCTVLNPVTGVTYDLWKLPNTEVNVKNFLYKYSFCRPLAGGCNGHTGAGACQVVQTTEKSNGIVNTTVVYTNGVVIFKYTGGDTCSKGDVRQTTINLVCDHALKDTELQIQAVNEPSHCVYEALAFSGLPCDKEALFSCEIEGYDITPLSLTRGNYIVKSDADFTFMLNVCRGVNSPSPCSAGTSVCLAGFYGTGISVGSVSSAQLVYEHSELKLKYKGADICSSTGKPYETYIKLLCSADDSIGTPQYLSTMGCSYHFLWKTKFACEHTFDTDGCKVLDTTSGETIYDLSALSGQKWEVSDISGKYSVSVCGALPDTTCKLNSAVCHSKDGKSQSLGVISQHTKLQVSGEEGPVLLTYGNGDQCKKSDGSSVAYRTVITFSCADHDTGLALTSREDCITRFTLGTPLVCSTETLSCEVTKGDQLINLASLRINSVYQVQNEIPLTGSMTISVCRSIPQDASNTQCDHPRAASCLTDFNSKLDLGHITTPLHVNKDGNVELVYDNGDSCTLSNGTMSRFRTEIIFKCSTDSALVTATPRLVDRTSCTYYIEIETGLVCAQDSVDPVHGSCQLTDPQTGFIYDLTKLTRNALDVYQAKDIEGNTYTLNICGALDTCGGDNTTVCLKDGKSGTLVPLGRSDKMTSSIVAGEQGEVEIQYQGGGRCSGSDALRRSVIVVMCCSEEPPLKLQSNDGCTYKFTLCSVKVCQYSPKECTFKLGADLYDFSPLARRYDNWEVTDGQIKYFVNMCRGVNARDLPASGCTENSVVCLSEKAVGETQSLGLVETRIQQKQGDVISLKYSGGSEEICTDRSARTEIVFSCGPGLGKPVFVSKRECVYKFNWNSYVACTSSSKLVTSTSCRYENPLSHNSVDLGKVQKGHFTVTSPRGTVYFSSCGKSLSKGIEKGQCDKSDVCYKDLTNGDVIKFKVKSKELFVSEDSVETVLHSALNCADSESKTWSAVVQYRCNETSTAPYFTALAHCHILLRVETPLVCDGYKSQGHHTIFYIVIAACVIFAALLLVYICINKSRRDKVLRKIRSIIPVRGARSRAMVYKRLRPLDRDISELLSDSDEEILEM